MVTEEPSTTKIRGLGTQQAVIRAPEIAAVETVVPETVAAAIRARETVVQTAASYSIAWASAQFAERNRRVERAISRSHAMAVTTFKTACARRAAQPVRRRSYARFAVQLACTRTAPSQVFACQRWRKIACAKTPKQKTHTQRLANLSEAANSASEVASQKSSPRGDFFL